MTRQESILALGKEICRAAEGEEALLGLQALSHSK